MISIVMIIRKLGNAQVIANVIKSFRGGGCVVVNWFDLRYKKSGFKPKSRHHDFIDFLPQIGMFATAIFVF